MAALFAVKFAVLFVVGRIFKMGLDQNLVLAFSLAQGGEFAFVLFSFATQQGVLKPDVTGPLIAVVATSGRFGARCRSLTRRRSRWRPTAI